MRFRVAVLTWLRARYDLLCFVGQSPPTKAAYLFYIPRRMASLCILYVGELRISNASATWIAVSTKRPCRSCRPSRFSTISNVGTIYYHPLRCWRWGWARWRRPSLDGDGEPDFLWCDLVWPLEGKPSLAAPARMHLHKRPLKGHPKGAQCLVAKVVCMYVIYITYMYTVR